MGVFSDDKREITCIYNSKDRSDKQTLSYLQASEKSLLSLDISKQQPTGTQWVELSKRLGTSINTLIDDKEISGDIRSFSETDCITILRENPSALRGAIVFTENKAKLITNPTEVLTFIDADSKNIPRP
ncbi:arsenate reductase-like glutaredoxin family protein [Winogradskyella epiphytica]|uniref:Arsenate reductase-like glutaredoxin family protein n=1 Tax=Winogradskyella epiphytica TaxID=262005 RepID=A0A2V4X7N4_9FLAO|nr:hypothetical protein [Winogradskyella epiphytica]PYE81649.1 arsenate reductase-like glutaredoxin family protein [Winogradskyella epiphytica]GGW63643.1 hypothetical protein GCM10008085_14450 [Winogradskyella epiphytica]